MKIKKKKSIQDLNGEEETLINIDNYYNQVIIEENNEQNNKEAMNEKSSISIFNKKNESNQLINKFNLNNIESPSYVVLFPKLS